MPRQTSSTRIPYTTLFRSRANERLGDAWSDPRNPIVKIFGGQRPKIQSRASENFNNRISRIAPDRKSTRLNSSHVENSYAVFCLKKRKRPMSYKFRISLPG